MNYYLRVCMLFAFIRRIQIEEAVLTEQFGNAYIDYAKKTKRLIPFIY
jgi:protein-S-isoprenylcysteine O-methyltransferase Ste14